MKIIVCGAGKIGQNLVKFLTHSDNDIVVIDSDENLLKEMSSLMDIQGICGNCSHPDVLEQAGALGSDMIIAMTGNEQVNMMTCFMATNIFKVPTKIARISSEIFIDDKYASNVSRRGRMISKMISPENELAMAVTRSLNAEWATEIISIADEKMRFIGVECGENFIFTNAQIKQIPMLLPDINIRIIMIVRDEEVIFPTSDEKIIAGDEVYFSIPASQLQMSLENMNISSDLKQSIVIIGGGKVGHNLAKMLDARMIFKDVTLVEKDEEKAAALAEKCENISIICGDILDDTIQDEINFENKDIVISLMGEELNIISSLLAKNKGVKRTIATIENDIYDKINEALGVDILIDSNAIIVSSILRYVRKGVISAGYSLKGDIGEILEGIVQEDSQILGKSIQEIENLEISVIYIERNGEFLVLSDDTIIELGDKIALFSKEEDISKTEKIFMTDV